MEASKLILSDEFKAKVKKDISPRHKRELMWQNLQIADRTGKLQQAKFRYQVGLLAGCRTEQQAYQYCYNLIKRKDITETFRGYEGDKATYEYHLARTDLPKTTIRLAGKAPEPVAPTPPAVSRPEIVKVGDKPYFAFDLTITTDKYAVKLEKVNVGMAVYVIKELFN